MKIHRVCAALALACLVVVARAAAADPLEGKWLGIAGFATDRVELGFEFKANAKGTIDAFLYSPVANFYGLPIPGEFVRDGAGYANKDWAIALSLQGDGLDGTMFFNHVPFTLKRTDHLPSETPVPDLPQGPGPKWQAKLGAGIYARAALMNGTAYVGTSGGMFYAVKLSTGDFAWAFAAGRPVFGEALVTAANVYFVCDNGYLFKLDRQTGKEIWRYDLGDERSPRILPHQVIENSGDFDFDVRAPKPVLAGNVLYAGAGDGGFHAVDSETGKRLWRFQARGAVRGDAIVDGSQIYFGTFEGILEALDRTDGHEVWQKNTQGPISGSIALVGGTIVLGNRYGLLAGLDPQTGQSRWRMQLWGSAVESTAALDKGSRFFIGSSDLRRVSYMDANDGRVLWRTDVLGWAWARPEVSGARVFVSAGGSVPYQMRHLPGLLALDRASGKILWRWPMPDTPGAWATGFVASPAAGEGLVVVGGLDGSLYAFPAN